MGAGRVITRLAAIGAAIGGVVFFWRKRHPHPDTGTGAATPPDFPPAADGK
jgi:hypothetical protein